MMTLEEIEALWLEDSEINELQLATEALKIPKLHAKYYQLYIREKLSYTKMKEKEKDLEKILTNFYKGNLSDEEVDEYGLEYENYVILKPEIPKAVASHKDMITYKLKMAVMYEKMDFLKSILQMIGQRSFQIKDAIAFKKFEAGD